MVAALCALLATTPAAALVRGYHFERVTSPEDLAQNTVNTILQDRSGFVWIGTQGGLHRHDGYDFRVYQHDPENPDSLPDSFVTALAEDGNGRLWIGTNGSGVAWYDAAANRFVPDDDAGDLSHKRAEITALMHDPASGLWIGSHFGIEVVTPEHAHRDVLAFGSDAASEPEVNQFARGGDGTIWAATTLGLYRIDPKLRRAERVRAAPLAPALSVFVDRDAALWVGTAYGLHRVNGNEAERAWPPSGHEGPGSPRIQVYDIEQAADGRLWLAVYGGGLVVFDPTHGNAEWLRQNQRLPGSLPEDSVRVLTPDRSGLLWIGGDVHGVARVDPGGAKFAYVFDDDASRPFVDTNNLRSLYEAEDGALWIGTEGDGLKRYDWNGDHFEYYAELLRETAKAGGEIIDELRVFAIRAAGAGALWVATNHGVFHLDPATRAVRTLPVDLGGSEALPDRMVRALIVGKDGSLWLGTFSSGLVRYQPESRRWTMYRSAPADASTLWNNTVLTLHEDRLGRIWIGTFDGLNVLDPASGVLRRIPRSSDDRQSIAGNLVRAVHESPDGTLWIGTHSGLSRLIELSADGARFQRYLARDGLPNPTVYGILEDPQGNLWLSTNRGIVRFDRKDGTFRSYTLEDGLQSLEFNGGAALMLRDGRLAFGGLQGLNVLDPARVASSTYKPPLAFTAVQVGNRRREVNDPAAFRTLAISQRDRIVGFEFTALDFGAPGRNRYEYRLRGFDEQWLANGPRRDVTFTNLDPGSYTLEVRATNRDQVWSTDTLALALTVEPLWWSSTPMKLLYALTGLLALGIPIAGHRRKIRREQQYTRQLKEREERLRVAIWGSGDEFWDWDIRRGVLFRVGADSLLGFENEQAVSGDDWRKHAVHPEDLPRVERILGEHVAGQREFFESEHRIRNAKGEWIWVLSRGKIVERDEAGQPMRIAGTARDITRTREAERERRIAEEVIRSMGEAVTVTELDFRFSSINPAFTRMTGYTETEIVGQPSAILNCEQHSEDFHQALRNTLIRTGHWSGEIWQKRKDGEEFLCWLELSEVTDRNGVRTHWVGVLTDITDRKRAEQELRYLANYDTLTGLPNRTLLGERLAHALIRARRHGAKVAVLFLDLDRFKHVNDSMGHAAGDRLLKAAAARIQANVRESDTVARLGGDEFTVIIEDLTDQGQAERVAQKLIDSFLVPLDIDGRTEVVISPSIGISIYPDHGQVPTDLLKFADTAMYQAKDKGRNTYQTYTEAMDAHARLRASMVSHLHKAVERGEFHVVYQPKMSLADGRITGVEALLRWRNPDLGLVPPSTFIPLAEETGLIVSIGEWVLREACVQVQRWTRAGIGGITMAVNVSMLQLLRGELYARLRQILDDFSLPAHRIELELTESMVMANAEQSISTLTQLKSLGVNLAIDDFGTGYSSLAYLKRLPIDTLKIDKEFVGDITTDPDDEAITATVITMAHSLGLDVVAEGVETQEQLDYLREQRCDEVQGNLISPPQDPERLLKFLLDRRSAAEKAKAAAASTVVREFPTGAKRS
jgi:diguanylate cyclase (GGDEF)-like protein/PAS domain S-box-containing protein